ncbi:hypothetical protein BDW62DRAFT_213533 [Aspergillus aurantiobrunneus]
MAEDDSYIATRRLGSPCHDPHHDKALCGQLQAAWTLPELHYTTPSSIMAPFFANDSCDPFHPATTPCSLGNYVPFAVNVSHPNHVSTALSFASTHNIRLVIRKTGHDYQGKSTGAGALALWMHNLKGIDVQHDYADAFYTGPAIRMGAGVQGFEAYAAADRNEYQAVGGECPSVGIAGGYTQGGGHSALSSRYGLAADQALAWEVVDGLGRHLVATRDNEHKELYWSLSGGGGGNYAVVLGLTARLHRGTAVSGLNLTFERGELNNDVFFEAVGLFQTVQGALADSGAMGISIFTNESLSLKPFRDGLYRLGVEYTLYPGEFASYLAQFESMQGPIDVGIAQYGGNEDLTAAYRHIVEDGAIVINVGLNVSPEVVGDVDNAVLPAWRDTLRRMTEDYVPRPAELAPESGAYLNEGDFRQSDFQRAFYGQNYDRLRSVKARYDPDDLFYALTGVGSKEWTQRADGRLCRVETGTSYTWRELSREL